MPRIDGYLSNRAQTAWPGALVLCEELTNSQCWTLERPGMEPVEIGHHFKAAHMAIVALIKNRDAQDVSRNAKRLSEAWKRYVDLFGEPPHGTEQQLAALLELVPKS